MTKTKRMPPSLARSYDVDLDEMTHTLSPASSRHLIILVPTDLDYSIFTRRVCRLAEETNSTVRLLALYKDPAEELPLRRELVTMSALLRDAHVCAEISIERGTGWVEAIRHYYQASDILVCIADPATGIGRKPLSQVLESSFSAPVYILSGPSPQRQLRSTWLSGVMSWTGSIAIIAGAFLLQIQIVSITADVAQTILLILSMVAEIWLIWAWNSLFE